METKGWLPEIASLIFDFREYFNVGKLEVAPQYCDIEPEISANCNIGKWVQDLLVGRCQVCVPDVPSEVQPSERGRTGVGEWYSVEGINCLV